MFACGRCPQRPEKGEGSPVAGVKSAHELPNVSADPLEALYSQLLSYLQPKGSFCLFCLLTLIPSSCMPTALETITQLMATGLNVGWVATTVLKSETDKVN